MRLRRLVVVGLLLGLLGVLLPVSPVGGQVSGRLVSGVSVSGDGEGVAVVSWTAPVEAPVDYRVMWARADLEFLSYRYEDEAERGNSYPAGSAVSVRLEGLTPGAQYKAVVRARYGPGRQGPWSDHASGPAGQPDDSTDDNTDDNSENDSRDDGDDQNDDSQNDSADDNSENDGDSSGDGQGDGDGNDNSENDGDGSGDGQGDGDGEDDGGGLVDGGIIHGDGDGFDLVGVMSVASAWVGDQEVLGYSLRGGGVGSFATTSVGDEQYAGHVGGRGFLNGLMRVPGRYDISRVGEYDDALVLMTQFGLAAPFLLEVGGRLYSSASASALNVRGYSDKFWVWEDPCARWAEGEEVAVSFDDGAASAAALRSADASLASLELAGTVLGQEFSAAVLDYSAAVGDGVSRITVNAAAADPNACSVEISPPDADPDTAGHQIDMDTEDGAAVTVAVTAGDGSTAAVYTVTVSAPGGALPATAADMGLDGIPGLGFDPGQRRYETVVPPATTSTTVRVRTAPGTTVDTTAYRPPPAPAPVAPRAPKSSLVRSSQPPASTSGGGPQQEEVGSDGRVDLPPGQDTVVVVRTSTEDNERQRIYTARLQPAPAGQTRSTSDSGDPALSGLSVSAGSLSPAFDSATRHYSVSVGHSTRVITIAPTTATGTSATVSTPDADPKAPGHQVILNAPGTRSAQTAITIVVARGAKLDTYTLTITRNTQPRLSGLSIEPATWTERTNFDTTDSVQNAEVSGEHSHITVTATTPSGVTATFSAPDADTDTPGHQIALAEPVLHHDSRTQFTVTAASGTDSYQYSIIIWRRWRTTGSEPQDTDFPANNTTPGRIQIGGSVTGSTPSHAPWIPYQDFYLGNDFDWFAVDLVADQRYVVDLTAWSYHRLAIILQRDATIHKIVDSSGAVQPNTFNDDWGLGRPNRSTGDSRVYFTPAATGTYYIEVTTVVSYFDHYRLSIDTTDEVDIPAGTASTARVTADTDYRGIIDHASDTDWVGMQLQAGVEYRVTARNAGQDDRGIGRVEDMAIMDADGNQVTSHEGPWRSDSASSTFTPATTGTYFAEIKGRYRLWEYTIDPYHSGVYIVSLETT